MQSRHWDRLAAATFLIFLAVYLALAWFASQDAYHATFDSIHGYRIFDIDDSYRRYLAATPFGNKGVWFWNFYLPFNLLFDGFFSWLTHHDTFWMRVPHLVCNLLGLWFVYKAGRHLGIGGGWMLLACCTLLWMPLYALVSMSFYGESLLAAVMGMVIYAIATERQNLLWPFAAVMPFIRPEGAFYLSLLTIERLWKRRFTQAALMMVPAFLYFLALMWVFDFSFGNYWHDRSAYGSIYSTMGAQTELEGDAWLPYFTINPLWWLAGLAGGFLPSMRRFWPLFAGGLLLIEHWIAPMAKGTAHGETRYFFSLLPLLALYQAVLLQAWINWVRVRWRRLAVYAAVSVMLAIGAENVLQLDPLRHELTQGKRYPFGYTEGRAKSFEVLPKDYSRVLKEAYAFTCAYTKYDPSVDKVIVNAFEWFNKMDVCELPERVRVELAFQNPEVTYRYLDGYFFGMFPALPHYSFYRFSIAPNERIDDGNRHALYVTMSDNFFPAGVIVPLFTNQVFNVYKVSYQAYLHTPFFFEAH